MSWKFTAEKSGPDILVKSTTATWFGGANDPLDNGQTASGLPTKGNPFMVGCSLPLRDRSRSTAGSPIPGNLPWLTLVEITAANGNKVLAPLIDIGPAQSAGDGIDLTQAAFRALGYDLRQGVIPCSYRILGAASYLG